MFANYYFDHYIENQFCEFHYHRFESKTYGERSIKRAVAAPRGAAKSTLVALIEPIHDICYGREKFIVIFSNTEGQAVGRLRDIRAELLTNVSIIRDFGIGFSLKKPAQTSFIVQQKAGEKVFEIMLSAYGSGTEVRGIRFGPHRPTKIIVDDGEHSEKVFNEELRAKYHDWYFEVVSKLGTKKTNIEVVGTILHRESHLKNLARNPAYDSKLYKSVISWSTREDLWQKWREIYTNIDDESRKTKAEEFYRANEKNMLEGTKVLWEEREPYLDLMIEMVEIGKRAFMKEKQNEPLGAEDKIFDEIHWYRETNDGLLIEKSGVLIPWDHLHEAYGALDPATGQTKAKKGKLGDYTCLLTGYYDAKGRLLVHHDWTKRAAPAKYIGEIFEHHAKYNYNKFGVETNLYRELLLPNIVDERKRREKKLKKVLKIPFYDIDNRENKEKRIYTLEPKVTHGWILFNRNLTNTFMDMLIEFPHADHDDGPDALEMLWGLVHNRYKPAAVSVSTSK